MPIELSIEGQDVGGSWKWVKAYQEQVRTPVRRPARDRRTRKRRAASCSQSENASRRRPGSRPLARDHQSREQSHGDHARIAVGGALWNTANYRERHRKGSAPFEAAYASIQEWGNEGAWQFQPIANDTRTIAGTHGKSGWGHPTFFAHNRVTGEWFVGSLGYSGNWKASLWGAADEARDRAKLFFSLGPAAADPALRVLEPGETVTTPETHMLLMAADLDHVIQALHEHVRREVLLPPFPAASTRWSRIIAAISWTTRTSPGCCGRSTWRTTLARRSS